MTLNSNLKTSRRVKRKTAEERKMFYTGILVALKAFFLPFEPGALHSHSLWGLAHCAAVPGCGTPAGFGSGILTILAT